MRRAEHSEVLSQLQASAMGAARSWRRISAPSAVCGTTPLAARYINHRISWLRPSVHDQLSVALCCSRMLVCGMPHTSCSDVCCPLFPLGGQHAPQSVAVHLRMHSRRQLLHFLCRSTTARNATCADGARGWAWTPDGFQILRILAFKF